MKNNKKVQLCKESPTRDSALTPDYENLWGDSFAPSTIQQQQYGAQWYQKLWLGHFSGK